MTELEIIADMFFVIPYAIILGIFYAIICLVLKGRRRW